MNVFFSIKGRINRQQWWGAFLILFVASSLVSIFLFGYENDFRSTLREILLFLIGVAAIPISVKRLHDINLSGWFFLITLIVTTQ